MQGKIDEEVSSILSTNFLPQYPVNGWPIFWGLFYTFYSALGDMCEFKAPNVLQCGDGRRVKDILRSLKRYLSRMGLITWSPEQLQPWFETGGKNRISENPKRQARNMIKLQKHKFNTLIRNEDKLRPLVKRQG